MSQLTRAYGLSKVEDTRDLYNEWAATYNVEMAQESQDYVGPALASLYVLRALQTVNKKIEYIRILDAGCGTGLVGVQLARAGAKNILGVDLSPGMLDIAHKTGAYVDLQTTDLSKPLQYDEHSFGVVACIGTFTQGHVGPEAFDELVRVTEINGFIVATVLGSIWEDQKYKSKVEELEKDGKVQILSAELEDYRRGAGVQARMVVLRVLG